MILTMLNTKAIHSEILTVLPAMRATVANVLRRSRYSTESDLDECMSRVMVEALDYGVRTFDAGKGSARSHFTCFAKYRAHNWLRLAHHRFESQMPQVVSDDGRSIPVAEALPADSDPHLDMVRGQEIAGVRAAVASLKPVHRAVVEAFMRSQSWTDAAREVGVTVAMASRAKAALAQLLG
jgi:DNA-directed RNA polymerase specialized sigma24 family protein